MNAVTPNAYAALLMRTFTNDQPPDACPRVRDDVTDKGDPMLEFLLPNPTEPRFSISLEVLIVNKAVSRCTLRFGQATVSSRLSPTDAVTAIQEILDDHIVAIVRYKDRDAFDDRRVASGRATWLYQLPDDASGLSDMEIKLSSPAGFFEKLRGRLTGIFEVYRWSGAKLLER